MDKEKRKGDLEIIKNNIRSYPDFPKPGVLFRDVFSIMECPAISRLLSDILIETAKNIRPEIECIVGLDARGFLFGPIVALSLNIPFVPVRKKGKLPGEVVAIEYEKEYGKDTLEIQTSTITPGAKVLILDDLLATGGTLQGACQLVRKLQAEVVACLIVMELEDLKGREKIPSEVISLIQF